MMEKSLCTDAISLRSSPTNEDRLVNKALGKQGTKKEDDDKFLA